MHESAICCNSYLKKLSSSMISKDFLFRCKFDGSYIRLFDDLWIKYSLYPSALCCSKIFSIFYLPIYSNSCSISSCGSFIFLDLFRGLTFCLAFLSTFTFVTYFCFWTLSNPCSVIFNHFYAVTETL